MNDENKHSPENEQKHLKKVAIFYALLSWLWAGDMFYQIMPKPFDELPWLYGVFMVMMVVCLAAVCIHLLRSIITREGFTLQIFYAYKITDEYLRFVIQTSYKCALTILIYYFFLLMAIDYFYPTFISALSIGVFAKFSIGLVFFSANISTLYQLRGDDYDDEEEHLT